MNLIRSITEKDVTYYQWQGNEAVVVNSEKNLPPKIIKFGDRLEDQNLVWTIPPDKKDILFFRFRIHHDQNEFHIEFNPSVETSFDLLKAYRNSEHPALEGKEEKSQLHQLLSGEQINAYKTENETIPTLRDIVEFDKNLDNCVFAFHKLCTLAEKVLDLELFEADKVSDAVDLAIDQVQDMRIAWLESGPEIKLSHVVIEAILFAVGGAVVNRLANVLLARGLRSYRGSLASKGSNKVTGRQMKIKKLQEEQRELTNKIQVKNEIVDKDVPMLYEYRKKVAEKGTDRDLLKLFEKAGGLSKEGIRNWREVSHRLPQLKKQYTKVTKKLTSLSQGFESYSLWVEKSTEVKAEAVDYLLPRVPEVSKLLTEIMQDVVRSGIKISDKPTRSPVSESVNHGYGPSAMLRQLAIQSRYNNHLEIKEYRQLVQEIRQMVELNPADAVDEALDILLEIIEAAKPELEPDEYMNALHDLAREIEFKIWAFLIPTTEYDSFSGGGEKEGFYWKYYPPRGPKAYKILADERVKRYLLERFGSKSKYKKIDKDDLQELAKKLHHEANYLNTINKELTGSDDPLLTVINPGIMKAPIQTETEQEPNV